MGLFAAASVVLLVRFDWRVADELVALDAELELLSKHVRSFRLGDDASCQVRTCLLTCDTYWL